MRMTAIFHGPGGENFVMVPLSYLRPEQYNALYDQFTYGLYVRYQRSDNVSGGAGGYNPEDYYGRIES
jgi:hypothetical protein